MKRIVLLTFAMAAIAAHAQYNVDFHTAFGVPTSAYSAAAPSHMAGDWNSFAVSPGGAPAAIFDLAGNHHGVTVQTSTPWGNFQFNNPGTSGDDEALMDDFLDGTGTITISGLAAGLYNVYTYAWAADSATATTNVSVNGLPNQEVGGPWPGGHVLGVTHALHTVSIGAGENISIVTTAGVSFASLNGFQVELVPEPATLAILGSGLLLVLRRRKK